MTGCRVEKISVSDLAVIGFHGQLESFSVPRTPSRHTVDLPLATPARHKALRLLTHSKRIST